MTLDDLRTLAAELVPANMQCEIEPYTLTPEEAYNRYHGKPGWETKCAGYHFDLAYGEQIETVFIVKSTNAGTARFMVKTAILAIQARQIDYEQAKTTSVTLRCLGLLH